VIQMPSAQPRVSVIMPTYNGEKFLCPAIGSILAQTFTDFELIVVDDGSTDGTVKILGEFNDRRIVVIRNEQNLGIARATNRALAAARGEYIALQDHDDISLPDRFKTQVEFLDSHSEIAVVGSAAVLIDDDGNAYGRFPLPCEEIDIKWRLLFAGDPFHYTSLMFRKVAIDEIGGYGEDPQFQFSEAYDPFSRIAMRHRVINLPQALVHWRRHGDATSITHVAQQARSCEVISFRNCSLLIENGSNAGSHLYPDYLGFKAFLFTPAGRTPDLRAEQIIRGLEFLCEVQKKFYRQHNFSRAVVARHRKPLNWLWGKHAVALAMRAPWGWRSRARMFRLGVRCLRQATGAALSSLGEERSARSDRPVTGIGPSLGPILYQNAEPPACAPRH